MKISSSLTGALASLAAAQTPAPYTDAKSGITFNTLQHSSGMFFGLALPANATANTDFIATIGGTGTGWSGVSLGGGMLNKLLIVAWPNAQTVVSSFRKVSRPVLPGVVSGTFTQLPIANGTYVNSTHWTYTFLCSNCILADKSTFKVTDAAPSIGYALSADAPTQREDPGSSFSKHTTAGQVAFDLSKARSEKFDIWKGYAAKPMVGRGFVG